MSESNFCCQRVRRPFACLLRCFLPAILQPVHSFMGPIHNSDTEDCNDSIKPRSFWMVYRLGPIRAEYGSVGGIAKCALHARAHARTISSLIYFRSGFLLARTTLAVSRWFSPVTMQDKSLQATRSFWCALDWLRRTKKKKSDITKITGLSNKMEWK